MWCLTDGSGGRRKGSVMYSLLTLEEGAGLGSRASLPLSYSAAEQLGQAGGRGLSCHLQHPLSQDKQEFSGLW